MEIGVFGGSFNPVHIGHIGLAKAMVSRGVVDNVWLILSPHNPLKEVEGLASDEDRLEMLKLACRGQKGLHACDVELTMPRPSYTVDTLRELSRRYPQHRFRLIIGADNMAIFDRWREPDYILSHYSPIVYPRAGFECADALNLPMFDVSSTEIRDRIAQGKPLSKLLPPAVEDYIRSNRLYLKQ